MELQPLRGLHRTYPCAQSVSLRRAEALSARGGQNCVQTRDRVGGASPAVGRRAVPPRLSLG